MVVVQRKFAIFEISTHGYGKNVWSREKVKEASYSGHKSAPEYVENLTPFEKKCFLVASVIYREKIRHKL